jgi:hypothetical protein
MSTIGLILLLLFVYSLLGPFGIIGAYAVFVLAIFAVLTNTSGTF